LRGLCGPGGIQLHSPGLAAHSRTLNRYLRYETGISPRLRELAILVVAREVESQFEWAAHEHEARAEGISAHLIDIVRERRPVAGLDVRDAVVVALGREIFGARKVMPETFARALEAFGAGRLVDLVALMGNYAATAALLTAFDMQLDEGVAPPF
jgi:4-carboxymuconolactone decarboxylase